MSVLAKYTIEKACRIPTEAVMASEFRYSDPVIDEHNLVIIISQSGETADSLAAMRLAKKLGAKTLFATHYHELNEMEKTYERVKNFNVQVKEINNKVVFLRKLTPGGSEHSFGIHVAKMAGMPRSIVERATKILKQLEKEHSNSDKENLKNIDSPADGYQLSIFQLDDPVLKSVRDEIVNTDIDNLTPIEALNKLYEIKKIVTGKENK